MREVKDVIHFYLGTVDFMVTADTMYYSDGDGMGHELASKGDVIKVDLLTGPHLFRYPMSGRSKKDWIGYLLKHAKPILRKLSSMTEEEIVAYLKLKHNAYSGTYGIQILDNGFWWSFQVGDPKFKFFGEVIDESNADQFQYLLSKGFDLFDLIPNGLAIEKQP